MKFEFRIALKYLLPRKWRNTSSFISIFSIGIISLVVWLSVFFLSIISGIKDRWIQDLSRIHSPIKVLPAEKYYQSYYYKIDAFAESSSYLTKTVGEKLLSDDDPYNILNDLPLPEDFPRPDFDAEGRLKNPVKILDNAFTHLKQRYNQLEIEEFEESFGYLQMSPLLQENFELKKIVQLVSYNLKNSHRHLLLPYDKLDYSSFALINHNKSLNWKDDWDRLSRVYNGMSVVLPFSYKEKGYKIGDLGDLCVYSAMGDNNEYHHKVRIIGFYDAGLSPVGSKMVFIDQELNNIVKSQTGKFSISNGFDVFSPNTRDIYNIKKNLEDYFKNHDIEDYWTIQTIYDNEHFKPILSQLQSDESLFFIISAIILLVACSNIVTMSILLVRDKKKEIGILYAMGASSRKLKIIFSLCGAFSGAIGSVLGIFLAILTLKNIQTLINFWNYILGIDAFNPMFFGKTIPNHLNWWVVGSIGVLTIVLAAISGILPARQITKMKITDIFKSG